MAREANRMYEEFEPPSDWDHEEGSDTLILTLPGFKKEQLKVQVTSTRALRVSGERQITENKWRRFRKEFPLPSDSETSGVSAKFEAGILYVKLPKLTNKQLPPPPPPTPRQESPKPQPQQPIATPQIPNNAQVSDLKQPRVLVDKTAAESKSEEQKPKKEKGKEKLKDDVINKKKSVAKERVEGGGVSRVEEKKETGSDDHGLSKSQGKMMEKKSLTMEMLSLQRKEYMNALSGLVHEVKKQKTLVNKLVLIFFVLLAGIYVKNVIKSYF